MLIPFLWSSGQLGRVATLWLLLGRLESSQVDLILMLREPPPKGLQQGGSPLEQSAVPEGADHSSEAGGVRG